MTANRCAHFTDVDAHFSGRLGPAREKALRAHLDDCAACRARYVRQSQLAELDPRALPVQTRMAFAIGIRRRAPRLWWTPGLATALALGAWLLVPRSPSDPDQAFRARGARAAAFALVVDAAGTEVLGFRTGAGTADAALLTRVHASDELAFAYRNADNWRHLMIFGRDDRGTVYWFQPAWTDPAADPAAVALEQSAGLHELPTAVAHDIAGKRLDLCALVMRAPLSVRQVEAALAQAPAQSPAQVLGMLGRAACHQFEVQP